MFSAYLVVSAERNGLWFRFFRGNLELLATHAVVGSHQPLLQIPDGPIGQWHHGFRAFVEVALQELGTCNMPESHLFKTGEALETVRIDGRAAVADSPRSRIAGVQR